MEMSKRKTAGFEFRIIAGDLKGKLITAPNLGITRPPLSRLRKAVFDFLTPYLYDESRYLDLFSGTGSYLFEAVSRGAGFAQGVELDRQLAVSINQQADKLNIANRLVCLGGDVFDVIPRLNAEDSLFDIVMIAPPQYQKLIDKTLICLHDRAILNPSAILICQHDTSETQKIDFLDFPVQQRRKYGNTTYTILTL